jgi:hypothetical protein
MQMFFIPPFKGFKGGEEKPAYEGTNLYNKSLVAPDGIVYSLFQCLGTPEDHFHIGRERHSRCFCLFNLCRAQGLNIAERPGGDPLKA